MNYKELYNKLPQKWEDFSLKEYLKLSTVISDRVEDELTDPDIITIKYLDDLDKNIQIISLLTGTSVEEIEQLTMVQLNELINKINFMSSIPKNPKHTIKYKQFNELSYDNFITFQKLSLDFTDDKVLTSAIHNLPMMLSVFSKDSHNEEYFLNQSMPEVIAGFFIVNQNIQKYLKRSQASLYKKMMKQQAKQMKHLMTLSLRKVNPFRKSLTKSGTIG